MSSYEQNFPHTPQASLRQNTFMLKVDMKTGYSRGGDMRVGIGIDVHRLVSGRKLVLGGETIPHEKGLLGHSDADVLIHALCDAILGAAGLGDIGEHFPDTSPEYRDISSMKILEETCALMSQQGLCLVNADMTLMAEGPKIMPYREKMRKNIAGAIGAAPRQINIKATTTEGLGFVGRGEGIQAMGVVLLQKNSGIERINE